MHRHPSDRITRFSHGLGTLVPDATSASVILLLIVAIAALAYGNSPSAVAGAYHRGLWMLLPFTMQMTLILVLSSSLGASPLFQAGDPWRWPQPRTAARPACWSVAALTAALSYFYWGLGIALGPLIAVHFAREAEEKGLPWTSRSCSRPWAAAMAVWQFGLSASAPLLMNTPGHFLETTTGPDAAPHDDFRRRPRSCSWRRFPSRCS